MWSIFSVFFLFSCYSDEFFDGCSCFAALIWNPVHFRNSGCFIIFVFCSCAAFPFWMVNWYGYFEKSLNLILLCGGLILNDDGVDALGFTLLGLYEWDSRWLMMSNTPFFSFDYTLSGLCNLQWFCLFVVVVVSFVWNNQF